MASSSNDGISTSINGCKESEVASDCGKSRTIIWCAPRSVSTALTKCLSFVDDIQVWFEPYTYCRVVTVQMKEQLGLDLPVEYEGNEDIYTRLTDHLKEGNQGNYCKKKEFLAYATVKRVLEDSTSPHVLVKDMAFAFSQERYKFIPKGYTHIFLIRHPLRVFSSLRVAVFGQLSALGMLQGEDAQEETFDIQRNYPYANPGVELHKDVYDVWKYVRESLGAEAIVVDSDDLLLNPDEMLPKICRATGLPYDESLLRWDGSSEVTKNWMLPAENMVENLKYIYGTAINSSGFLPSRRIPSRDAASRDVIRCTDQGVKYYDEMYKVRLTV
ncbi:uncharacterized protein LOC129256397 [Lytechinus pictus]|uniref:uncharacterized protein LOC129256397 n=1 Tax=Lytechinus pictus TaxID=7653 RepID=UPI0030B9F63F